MCYICWFHRCLFLSRRLSRLFWGRKVQSTNIFYRHIKTKIAIHAVKTQTFEAKVLGSVGQTEINKNKKRTKSDEKWPIFKKKNYTLMIINSGTTRHQAIILFFLTLGKRTCQK